jgi:hypothetical protein
VLDTLTPARPRRFKPQTGLTVGALIALLKTFEPGAQVLVRGEHGGLDVVLDLHSAPVRLNVNRAEGFGPHELASADEEADGLAVVVQV